MKRGLIIISNVEKAMEHEWFAEFVDKKEFALDFVLFNSKDSELYHFLKKHGFKCRNYRLPSKYYVPFYALFFTTRLFFKRYDFVHCHLFEASLIGILSAKLARIKKRIYTRHHGDFHHVYFPSAVKYDLLVNRNSTHIIAVSSTIKKILIEKESVPADKIIVIPHGIPEKLLGTNVPEQEIVSTKQKYGLSGHRPVIGVISRFTEWKGIQYTIPAFKKLLANFPKAKLVLANAKGEYEKALTDLLHDLDPSCYVTIPFEPHVNPLFLSFDLFVHVPVDCTCEAFGQVYIEALNHGIPMVCTLSGIANELIRDKENALVVPYKNSDSIYNAMLELINNQVLREKIIRQGKKDVKEFTFEKKYAQLRQLYRK